MSDVSGSPQSGQHPVHGVPPSGPGLQHYGQPPSGWNGRDPDARPGTVLAAGIITLVMSGLMLALMSMILVVLLAVRSGFLQGLGGQVGVETGDPGNRSSPFTWLVIGMVVLIGWCLAALVLATLVLRRSNAARIALVVSSGLTALVSLVAITGGFTVLTLAGAIAVIVLLFTGGAGDWFHREHLYSPPSLPRL